MIRSVVRNQLLQGAFCLALIAMSAWIFVHQARLESRRESCRAERSQIARAEVDYYARHGAFLKGSWPEVAGGLGLPEFACRAGGRYSISFEGTRVIVHCSISEHDRNGNGGTGAWKDASSQY